MKLLIIQDESTDECGLMIVPDIYDDVFALEQASVFFIDGRIAKQASVPIPVSSLFEQYRLYRVATQPEKAGCSKAGRG